MTPGRKYACVTVRAHIACQSFLDWLVGAMDALFSNAVKVGSTNPLNPAGGKSIPKKML
jgi:hypothetical protein